MKRLWREIGPAVRGGIALFSVAILLTDTFDPHEAHLPRWHVLFWTLLTLSATKSWWDNRKDKR